MRNLSIVFILSILIAACDKNQLLVPEPDPENSNADITIDFVNTVDGAPLKFGLFSYTNAAGNTYMINVLKYYISAFRLVSAGGDTITYNQYELIDASDETLSQITLPALPNNTYTEIIFNFGVDSLRNHDGDQEGDLDPVNGMIWTWATGYIFFKHEGKFINADGDEQFLLFHYGTDRAFVPDISIPLSDFTINGEDKNLKLQFNLNAMYYEPNLVDFNVHNNHQSVTAADIPWIGMLHDNLSNVFSFGSVE